MSEAQQMPAPGFSHFGLSHPQEAVRSLIGRLPRFWQRRLGGTLRRMSLFGHGPIADVVVFGDKPARLYPFDNHSDRRAYMDWASFDIAERAAIDGAISRHTRNGPFVLLDIGANSGLHTLNAAATAERLGVALQVVAIEAEPTMVERLRFNVAASGLDAIVSVVPMAVGASSEPLRLRIDYSNRGRTHVIDDGAEGEVVIVPSAPLAEIVRSSSLPQIDFIKIDVEGHEENVLGPFLASVEPDLLPAAILAETHGALGDPLRRLICGYGFEIANEDRLNTEFRRANVTGASGERA